MLKNTTTIGGKNILLIGSGRLAKHLSHWHSISSHSSSHLVCWNRKQHNIEDLEKKLQSAQIVWLAISDKALIPFYEEFLKQKNHIRVLHFSGALNYESMYSAHPLMTFSHNLYDIESYKKIYFALTGFNNLTELMPHCNNNFFNVATDQKALYHALCVSIGNLPQLIWQQGLNLAEQMQIPKEAITNYLEKSLQNSLLDSNAVSGPIIRNDIDTISKNLTALSQNSPQLFKYYKAFAKESHENNS